MASDTIAVRDEGTARSWTAKARELNQQTFVATQGVGQLLQDIQEGAGGELIDTLWNMGKSVIDGAGMIIDGVNLIIDGVDKIVDVAKDVVGIAKGAINALKSFFG